MGSLQLSQCMMVSRRPRRFVVSCEGGGGIDRRNLLMGLGGLYSAANLNSKSLALPIPPPDFNICVPSEAIRDCEPLMYVQCCPPISQTVTPYVLPEVTSMRLRKPAHKLDDYSIAQYRKAVQMMRDLDKSDPNDPRGFTQQANIHCAYCNGGDPEPPLNSNPKISVHYSWLFFPFHRWYLYFYERILGSLVGDPNFALPYWNWDNKDGMQIPQIFTSNSLYDTNRDLMSAPPNIVDLHPPIFTSNPLYDTNRDIMSAPPNIVDLQSGSHSGATPAQIINNNLTQMHNEMISAVSSTTDFMGKSYRAGEGVPPPVNGGKSELGSHTSVHKWVGNQKKRYHEDLGNFYSAGRDPLFYSHHANVDRMWTIWRNLQLGTSVPKNINDPDYLNSSFLFYDENKQLRSVTVADCIDYTKMGYDYQYSDITPWVNYRALLKTKKATLENLSKRADEKVTFPLTLDETRRILVQKPAKGKADEVLVLENVDIDPTKLIKFNIFINEEDDDDPTNLDRAEYAGTFAQLIPHTHSVKTTKPSSINYSLKELYQVIGIGDDDQTVVVTLYPILNGEDVKIGGIKIIKAPSF